MSKDNHEFNELNELLIITYGAPVFFRGSHLCPTTDTHTCQGLPSFGRILSPFGRICNPTTANIGICNVKIQAQNIMIIRNHLMNLHWQS